MFSISANCLARACVIDADEVHRAPRDRVEWSGEGVDGMEE
jgi:hypothetical protein